MHNNNPCSCNACKSVFDFKDTVDVKRNFYGLTIYEKKCPVCGSIQFSPMKEIHWYNKFLTYHN